MAQKAKTKTKTKSQQLTTHNCFMAAKRRRRRKRKRIRFAELVLLFLIRRLRRCRNGNGTSGFGGRRRQDTLSRAIPSGLVIVLRCFPFLKRASFTEPSLDLNGGLDLRTGGLLLFGCQSEGISEFLCADVSSHEPSATRHCHWLSHFKPHPSHFRPPAGNPLQVSGDLV